MLCAGVAVTRIPVRSGGFWDDSLAP